MATLRRVQLALPTRMNRLNADKGRWTDRISRGGVFKVAVLSSTPASEKRPGILTELEGISLAFSPAAYLQVYYAIQLEGQKHSSAPQV